MILWFPFTIVDIVIGTFICMCRCIPEFRHQAWIYGISLDQILKAFHNVYSRQAWKEFQRRQGKKRNTSNNE